ncbi:MAG: adenylate cyclase [Acidimicrobiia bacterium]
MTNTTLTKGQLTELIGLISFADDVELKLTVPDSDIRSTSESLGFDPLESEIRQVVFFDTPDLELFRAGVVVRARRIQGGGGDTVVKLRPVRREQLAAGSLAMSPVGVEIDAMPGGFVCSASMKGTSTAKDVQRVIAGSAKLKSILSRDQRDFYKRHAPPDSKLNSLATLGPINILKLKFRPVDLARKMVAELWMYPNGSRLLELSTKCAPSDAIEVAAETRKYLLRRGVDLTGGQAPKTKRALEHFAGIVRRQVEAEPALR